MEETAPVSFDKQQSFVDEQHQVEELSPRESLETDGNHSIVNEAHIDVS